MTDMRWLKAGAVLFATGIVVFLVEFTAALALPDSLNIRWAAIPFGILAVGLGCLAVGAIRELFR